MSEKADEVEIDDDELELAAGGIILTKGPSQQYPNSTSVTNSTIYFQGN